MSDDKKKPEFPSFLTPPEGTASRREVLRFFAAFGATLMVPSIAGAAGGSATHLPHGNIVALAMKNPQWRAQLIQAPRITLAKAGINFANNVQIVVVEDSLELIHVVFPQYEGMRGPEYGVVADIFNHFRTNQNFRNAVINNPRAVFEAWTGATIPEQLEVAIELETPTRRVIQLPPIEAEGLTQPAQVQALWGGGDDGGWGGEDWSISGTIESGQVCQCWSEGSDFESAAPNCCFEEPQETLGSEI